MGKNVSKSSLARANQNRDYRIFEEYAFYLVSEVQSKSFVDIFKLNGNVYAFDSMTIDPMFSSLLVGEVQKEERRYKGTYLV